MGDFCGISHEAVPAHHGRMYYRCYYVIGVDVGRGRSDREAKRIRKVEMKIGHRFRQSCDVRDKVTLLIVNACSLYSLSLHRETLSTNRRREGYRFHIYSSDFARCQSPEPASMIDLSHPPARPQLTPTSLSPSSSLTPRFDIFRRYLRSLSLLRDRCRKYLQAL